MMLFKKTKRLFAALLCFCMVAAIVPVTAPEAAAVEATVTVDFCAYKNSSYADVKYFTSGGPMQPYQNVTSAFASRTGSTGNWLAFDLGTVPAGDFDVNLKYAQSSYGGKAEIYLAKIDGFSVASAKTQINAALAANTSVAELNFYNATSSISGVSQKITFENEQAGNYVLIAKMSELSPTPEAAGSGMSYIYLESISFTPVADRMSIDFGKGKFDIYLCTTDTPAADKPKKNCFVRGMQTPSNNNDTLETFVLTDNVGLAGANLTIDLGVITGANLASGTYDITISYKQYPSSAIADIYLVPFDKFYNNWPNDGANIINANSPIGRVSFGGATTADTSITFKSKSLTAGNYVLVINPVGTALVPNKGNQHTICLKGIDIAPASGVAETEDEIFGDTYAYVKEDASGDFEINFIGAVKETDGYKEVGFEVWADGQYIGEAGTSEVYNSITAGGQERKPGDYGGSYIFVATPEDKIEGSTKKIIVRPYVKDGNDTKTYHGNKTFVVSLS